MENLNGIERAEEMLKLFKENKTYDQIGVIFGITKTRVWAELKKFFLKEVKEILSQRTWYVGKRDKEKKELKEFKCLNCGQITKSKYLYYLPKFCSPKCRGEFMKKSYEINKK